MKDNYKKYINLLKKHNLRVTNQRLAILNFLDENRIHPTADEIYTSLKNKFQVLSKATIYNSLGVLTKNGLIKALKFEEFKDVRYDYNTDFHAHFLCKICKKVYDLPMSSDIFNTIDSMNFKVEEYNINIKGICPACQNKINS